MYFSAMPFAPSNSPVFEESSNKEWVSQGQDNLWPIYLEELMLGSGMHNAIIKGVADMIYGHGLDSANKDNHIEQWLRLKALFQDETCLKRAALDLKLYGQCYLNPIWSQDRTSIVEVHHIPAATIRCAKANDDDEVETYYHSADWSDIGQNPPQPIPVFDPQDRTAASSIVHIKLYNPTSFYYGLPDYIGGITWAYADKQIAEFHASTLQQGLFPSMLINFKNGVPTEDERMKIERLIYDKFGSASNAGKFLITFSDSAEEAPSFEAFQPQDPQKTYAFYSEQIVTQVLSAHRVTSPLLFGLRTTGGGFGSNAEEMKEAYELFHNTVVRPMQETFIKGLRPMLSAMNITLDLHFKKLQPASYLYVEDMAIGEDELQNKEASYNGAQIASAVEVLVKVQEGIITEEQAKVFLVQMLQFSPSVADALFTEGVSAIGIVADETAEQEEDLEDTQAETQMSAQARITEEQGRAWLTHLADKNAPVPLSDYTLLKTEAVANPDADRALFSRREFSRREFGLEEYSNIDDPSEFGDVVSPKGYLYAVRYSYFKATSKTPKGNSRDFCVEMMDLSDSGVMYRFEDIQAMSDAGENSQFAAAGESTYSIFDWAGGKNCYHGWQRNIFIYDQGEYTFDDYDEALAEWDNLIGGKFEDVMNKVGNNPYVVQKGDEAVAPIDKQ